MTGVSAAIYGCSGHALTEDERAFFREAQPWGFIVFRRNVSDPVQLAALTAEMREAVGMLEKAAVALEKQKVAAQ